MAYARHANGQQPVQQPEQEQGQQQNANAEAAVNDGGDPADTMGQQVLNHLVSSPEFTKKVLTNLGKGDEMTIVVNDAEVIRVRNEGPTITESFLSGANQIFTSATSEVSRIVQADPAFAFKEAAIGVRTQVEGGLPREIAANLEEAWLPMLRIAALVLDSQKALDTWRNKDSSWIDRGVDTAHVVTDVIGLAGAFGHANWIPALSGVAPTLTAIGLAGDVLAYSVHVLAYLRERGQVNLNDTGEQAAAQAAAPPPGPTYELSPVNMGQAKPAA